MYSRSSCSPEIHFPAAVTSNAASNSNRTPAPTCFRWCAMTSPCVLLQGSKRCAGARWFCYLSPGTRKGAFMPRVREIDDAQGDPVLEEVFTKERALYGDLLNPTKVMAHCPPILRAAK